MKRKLIFLLAIASILITLSLTVIIGATEEPSLSIDACNLSFRDNVCIKYAVKSPTDDVKMLVWASPKSSSEEYVYGTHDEILNPVGYDTEIDGLGTRYIIFDYTKLVAKQMTDYVYVRAYIDGENPQYSDIKKYSILEYAYNMLGKTDTAIDDEDFKIMLTKMLEYGASAQTHFEYKADRLATADYYQVLLKGGALDDGCRHGLYLANELVNLYANTDKFTSWIDSSKTVVSTTADFTLTVKAENEIYEPIYEEIKYSEGLEFTSNGDGTCYVSGIGTCTDTDIIIPPVHNGEAVTEIGFGAFMDCYYITNVIIPDSVKYIGSFAFINCSGITNITIPSSVKIIEHQAFEACINLRNITIPNSVTSIFERVLSGCSNLESIIVDEGNAFYHSSGNCLIRTASKTLIAGCKNSVIPTDGSVTKIEDSAFALIDSLTSITIPDCVTDIGRLAFDSCGLTSIEIPDGVMSIGEWAFSGNSFTSIAIPDSITSIGDGTFSYCEALESITVAEGNTVYHSAGNCLIETESKTLIAGCNTSVISTDGSVTCIGDYAFSGCSNLMSITIPDSVTSIGYMAFHNCGSLTYNEKDGVGYLGNSTNPYIVAMDAYESIISIELPSTVKFIYEAAFSWCESLTSITIPGSVTSIGDYAFSGCSSLTSITIPDSVTSIGYYAFNDCSSLTSITIPNSVTSIGDAAFNGCNNLTSITIPDSVTSIGVFTFSDCTSLTSITIPDSVTSIENYVLAGCFELVDIYFTGTEEQWNAITKGRNWNSNTGEYTIHYNYEE